MEDYIEEESNNSNLMEKSSIDSNNQSSSFECNICLDLVQDPVVTLCGHLYCWPCIYKWLQSPTNVSVEQQEQPQCPVCKSEISDTALIPLYGRGQSSRPSKSKTRQLGIIIPKRPLGPTFDSPRSNTSSSPSLYRDRQVSYSPSYLPSPPQPFYSHSSSAMLSLSSIEPIIGTLEETLFARFFGSSIMNVDAYPRSYNHLQGISPRVQRHLARANRSLGRICFFLLCCCVLCLLLF